MAVVEGRHDLPRLLDRGDEGDQPTVEAQVGELDEQRVAHGLGADAGAVGQEEDRHRRTSAIQMSVHREAPLEFHPRVGGGRRFSRPDIMTPITRAPFAPSSFEGVERRVRGRQIPTIARCISSSIPRDNEPRQKRARRSLNGSRRRPYAFRPPRHRARDLPNSTESVVEARAWSLKIKPNPGRLGSASPRSRGTDLHHWMDRGLKAARLLSSRQRYHGSSATRAPSSSVTSMNQDIAETVGFNTADSMTHA